MHTLTTQQDLLTNHLPIMMAVEPPLFHVLSGRAGQGKTYLMTHGLRQCWADTNNVSIEEVGLLIYRCADRDAAEFAGLMMPSRDEKTNDLETVSIKPDLLRKIDKLRAEGFKYIVVILDEVLQASQDVQKTLSSMLDSKELTLGGWPLGEGLYIAGTGNRMADKSGARPALGHLRNRMSSFELEGYNDDTVGQWERDYAEPKGLLRPVIDVAKAHATDGFFDDLPPVDGAFCSFRTLTLASALISKYMERTGEIKISEVMQQLVASIIGSRAARVLADHFDCAGEVPTAEEILTNPETALLPSDTGYQMLAGTLALEIATDSVNADAAITYITRLRGDLQVQLGVRLLSKSEKLGFILISPVATQFIQRHPDLIALARIIEV
jgi:hypothetical protein